MSPISGALYIATCLCSKDYYAFLEEEDASKKARRK